VDDLIAEKGMKHLPVRLYQRKIRKSWRKSFPYCKGMFKIMSRMLIF
jgi:hypothetical protein